MIGFATITVVVLFLGTVQLICIGILGDYVGRIYEEVKGRPLYTLKQFAGFTQATHLPHKAKKQN